MPTANQYPCPRCNRLRLRARGRDCENCLRNEAERARWRSVTWPDFCAWLTDRGGTLAVERRVVREHSRHPDFDESQVFWTDRMEDDSQYESTYLEFDDGSMARMTSNVSASTPGYSEVTPGGPGYVQPPTIMLRAPDAARTEKAKGY